jgi:hypothetical protein
MIEPAGDRVLVLESTPRLGLMRSTVEDLEGDVDPARTIVRAPHLALAACA